MVATLTWNFLLGWHISGGYVSFMDGITIVLSWMLPPCSSKIRKPLKNLDLPKSLPGWNCNSHHFIHFTNTNHQIDLYEIDLWKKSLKISFVDGCSNQSKHRVERIFAHNFSTHPNLPDLMAGRSELYLSSLGMIYKYILTQPINHEIKV